MIDKTRLSVRHLSLAFALAILASAAAAATLVQTSFEAGEAEANYTAGQSIGTYASAGWTLEAGTATISTAQANEGAQSLALTAGAEVDRSLPTSLSNVTQNGIVWIRAYFRGAGSAVTSPEYPATPPASSIVHFSNTQGVLLYNGNGSGGGSWVQASGITGPLNASQWYQVTLLQDYQNAVWHCYINGTLQNASALGFRDGSAVTKLSGFKNLSDTDSYFDDLAIMASVRGDANGDAVVDSADVVRALELSEASPLAIDAIFGKNADVANTSGQLIPDGRITQQDYQAIAQMVLTRP